MKGIAITYPDPMALDVLVHNIPAIKLYESTGFQKVEGQNVLVAHYHVA